MQEAVLYLDNQAAVKATQVNSDIGLAQYLPQLIRDVYEALLQQHSRLDFEPWWIPGHERIKSNKSADTKAKKTANRNESLPGKPPEALCHQLPLSASAMKAAYKITLLGKHHAILQTANRLKCM